MRVKTGTVRSADGTSIAYRAMGSGRPILCCNGLGVSPYFWRHLAAYFGNRYQIITWEYRGHGKSGTPPHPTRLRYEELIADGTAVIAALDLRGIIGIGHSAGFQVVLGLYAKHPKRFAGLSSFLGTAGNALRFFFDSPKSRIFFDLYYLLTVFYPTQLQLVLHLITNSPIPYHLAGALRILTPGFADKGDLQQYLRYVQSMDPLFFATLTQGAEAHSAHGILPRVRVPTLYIAGANDRFVPLRISQAMHRATPKSELYVITRGTHFGLMEMPDVFNLRLEQFLARHVH